VFQPVQLVPHVQMDHALLVVIKLNVPLLMVALLAMVLD
jgi:hypothetical protein